MDNVSVNNVFTTRHLTQKNPQLKSYQPTYFMGQTQADTVVFSKPKNNVISFGRKGKSLNVVTFTGLKDPIAAQKPAIQMKVRGVMAHQYIENNKYPAQDYNVNTLAGERVDRLEPDKYEKVKTKGGKARKVFKPGKCEVHTDNNMPRWKDGQKLDFEYELHPKQGPRILLSAPGIGQIGRVHDELLDYLLPVLYEGRPGEKPREGFKFELSNIVAGTTKGAETAGLRVNLKYEGNNPQVEEHARNTFNEILNDKECVKNVMLYQEKTSPEDVLKTILDYEAKVNGPESKKEMEEVISNIVKEIKDPANKRILLLGHCKPDGDTIGCVLGLKNAISLMDPDRKVDCAIDDKMPGLFRHKMPGIDDEMKRPFNPQKLETIKEQLNVFKARLAGGIDGKPLSEAQVKHTKEQIALLEQEVQDMNNPELLLDKNAEYDLVITMDVPTHKRFTDQFKHYFDNAKKVVYIDHHPHRQEEWMEAADKTGLNMDKVHENKLAWIADAVPAATQLIAIIGNKLLPQLKDIGDGKLKAADVFKTEDQMNHLKAYVASLVTGASTDTGSFTRTANLLPEHIRNPETNEPVPVQMRPNFLPEGICKWLLDLTDGAIDKKWLREEITWDISDNKSGELEESARDIMLKHAIAGRTVYEDLSLGLVEVDYDQMNEVWQEQLQQEPGSTLLDIQNAFKYGEVIGTLRADPELSGGMGQTDGPATDSSEKTLREQAQEDYSGSYDSDRIAILICQDKKAGELDEKLMIADQNGLRLSLRSMEGSIHAELLASLFGGGGHGAAAGGRIDLPGIELDSPLVVTINGKPEKDMSVVHKELMANYEMAHKKNATGQKKQITVKIDDSGVPVKELIHGLVTEMRANQVPDEEKVQEKPKQKGRRPHFAGNVSNMFTQKVS